MEFIKEDFWKKPSEKHSNPVIEDWDKKRKDS